MPKVRLGPDENVRYRYSVPEDGWVQFQLDADHPVETYIVRPQGLEYFDEGSNTFKYYGGYPRARRKQEQAVRLPFDGSWYFLIVNRDEDRSVNVEFKVYL
jgi:hypothetical protein